MILKVGGGVPSAVRRHFFTCFQPHFSQKLAQVTDVLGHTWKYEYNAQGQITRRVDPLGASIELQYMTSPAMIPDSPGFAGMGAGGGTGGGGALASSGTGATKVSAPQIARVASYREESGACSGRRITNTTPLTG